METKLNKEQIKGLENRQNNNFIHNFTCMSHNDCDRSKNKGGSLIPTESKWICPCGKYTQEYDQTLIDSIPSFLDEDYGKNPLWELP